MGRVAVAVIGSAQRSIITLTERPQETAAAEGSVSNAADGSEPVVEQNAQDEFMDEKWLVIFDLNGTLLFRPR